MSEQPASTEKIRLGVSISESLSTIALVIAILSGAFSLSTYFTDEKRVSADFMLRFDQIINAGTNGAILDAIDDDEPILKPKGAFTEDQLGNLIDEFEILSVACDEKIINRHMAYEAFSEEVIEAYKNEEVRRYVADSRKDAAARGEYDIYDQFEKLALEFVQEDEDANKGASPKHP